MLQIPRAAAIELLNKANKEMYGLVFGHRHFSTWQMETKMSLGTIFGTDSPEVQEFEGIRFMSNVIAGEHYEADLRAYTRGLDSAGAFIRSMMERVQHSPEPAVFFSPAQKAFFKRIAGWIKPITLSISTAAILGLGGYLFHKYTTPEKAASTQPATKP